MQPMNKHQSLQMTQPTKTTLIHGQNKNHHKKQQLLHQYLNGQLILDTPSTTHALTNHHFAIKSVVHRNSVVVSKMNQELIKTQQKYERINSKILTVKEIKEEQAKLRRRTSSTHSNTNNRKIFVSIARSNSGLSQQSSNRQSQFNRESEEGRQKIKLAKYIQLRSGEKAVRRQQQ